MANFGQVRRWNPEPLHASVGELNQRCDQLLGLADELAAACKPAGWVGDAAHAAARESKKRTDMVEERVAGVAAVRRALGEAADAVTALRHAVAEADSLAQRYEELRTKIRSRLADAKFAVSWQERPDSSGGGGCSRDFPGVTSDDAQFLALPTWRSDGNVPDGKWDAAVAVVAEAAREYGFGDPKVVVNRPSDHEVSIRDGYGAEMLFGTAKNTILTLTTGCHLTTTAHQRGTPAPKPTH